MVLVLDWIIGVGLMFGFAFVFNYITFDNILGFLAYMTIFNGFTVYANLLPLWTLILNIIVLVLVMYYESTNKGVI